jgi:hypothetical protein
MVQLDEELKEALKQLPEKEKDKLIFRLLKHDLVLMERLRFELIPDCGIEELRERLKQKTDKFFKIFYTNPDRPIGGEDLYYYMRDMSGRINHHLNVTKDKYGEIELNIYLLHAALKAFQFNELDRLKYGNYKFCQYTINKSMRVLLLLLKLNADLRVDFREELMGIQTIFQTSSLLLSFAKQNEFELSWFDLDHLSDELPLIYKEARARGLYK